MEPGMRSGGPPGVFVKNRSSSGCLIVRKKGDGLSGGVGSSSSSRKMYESKKVKKRPKVELSRDSGSSGDLPMPPARRLGPETIRVCNGLNAFERGVAGGSEIVRKRDRFEQIRRNGDDLSEEDGLERMERKRSKIDAFGSDQYDDAMDVDMMRRRHFENNGGGLGGGRFAGAMHAARTGIDREFESGSSRHTIDKRKNSYHSRATGSYPGDNVDHNRFKMNRDAAQRPLPLLREKFNCGETIRIQGKNGVLKVMVKKDKMGGPLEHYDNRKPVESRQSLRAEGIAKKNVLIHPSSYSEAKPIEKQDLNVRPEKKLLATRKSSSKDSKGDEQDSDNSDTSLNVGVKGSEAPKSSKRVASEDEQIPKHEKLQTTAIKEGKIRRGSGTEKQKLREKIREMLLNSGWTIDYRPRRNRDYLDAVYINPAGTAYWSIIKAYEALQKQLNDDDPGAKLKGESSSFAPIADDVLSQLTRKTRKKMEKELKKKKKERDNIESDSEKERQFKISSSIKHDMNGMNSEINPEKLSSFLKQGSKSMKTKMIENAVNSGSSKSQNIVSQPNDGTDKSFPGNNPHVLHGRKSRKDGRCTLLIRNSNIGSSSESDDFVPYTGKRTVLSWLVDSGAVQLSQKVQYRRKKRVMLEGWITRDGIHCGCCSKILTVSKFELHAGSKLRQPYQNIYLDSGDSLLQCQIDAWSRQEKSEKISFHSVDIDGNDPNDDTCGICGDGGDLICCDSCPSTFHLSCLDIQMLPPGEWHCPNCTCKFCGVVSGPVNKDELTINALHICNLCEKKFHKRCTKEMDTFPTNSDFSGPSFCGKGCKELFEHLKKYLGTKHELDAGLTWSLIRRTDEDSDAANRGISQRVECNSKLAVALAVMDECFLPVVDRRSGINILHNVLYNTGSNFSRLNYTGFYTAILERGDEMISAASIRFRGTKLAEMPFIGTRHMYRNQGMCRRLFCAIELVLCSLKVEKLVIPAISELIHTWTTAFGFTHLEKSLRQEMRSLSMLVFPGIDMLQKLLVEQGKLEGFERIKNRDEVNTNPSMASRLDMNSSALQTPHGTDDASSNPDNDISNESSDASQEQSNKILVDRNVWSKSHSEDRLSDSASDKCVSSSSTSDDVLESNNKIVTASPGNDKLHPSANFQKDNCMSTPPIDASNCHENPVLGSENAFSDPDSAENMVEPVSAWKCHSYTDMNCDPSEHGINPALDLRVGGNALSFREFDMNDAHDEAFEADPSVNLLEENNKHVDISCSILNQGGESSLRVRYDLNDENAREDEQNFDKGFTSREMHMNDTELSASGDSSETDPA
ncbi:hypothetical protein HN51_056992 [Arachis hypogaea]|uniref:Increased DNA methylation n=1 Tax=Arachis hypogaea TaxID=3818 RepID=A0A444XVS7_ARAHY|nr:uncharacterized protein LOC107617207 [Arachis ipaensis]XP_025675773.1 uncharacterized protein LOC112776037 [Arachis hypogaea]QHN79973.1 Increased DNA methylation [Arachis hypogaea]RYQ93909.1 hypothetical protein Ahy_B09g100128 [Arachis hypogaea]